MEHAIIVDRVSKWFRREVDRPRRFSELFVHGWRRRTRPEQFCALKDISFRLSAGRMLGIIGRNGAGKSTLLRLVGRVGLPTEGHIETQGRIRALLDLGSTFQPDLTGRENIFLSGVVAGLTRRDVGQRLGSILDFAELESFADNPVRTYSTGMQTRLAFSVAVHTDPQILLVDEVLAVGDLAFQQKCLDRIQAFKSQGCSILLVSHDVSVVEQICDETLWLRRGHVAGLGEPKAVIDEYVNALDLETRRRTPLGRPPTRLSGGAELRMNETRFGSLEMEIVSVKLTNSGGEPVEELDPGAAIRVEIEYDSPRVIESPHFSVSITTEGGTVVFDATTELDRQFLGEVRGRGRIGLQIDRLELAGGIYYVNVGVYERDWSHAYDLHWHVYSLRLASTKSGAGILVIPHLWFHIEQQGSGARLSKSETAR